MSKAKLYGIGVGPGDNELLTLKAVRIISESHVIAYPAPPEGEGDSMARSIAADHIPKGKTEYPIRIPMVASQFPAQNIYDQTATDIAQFLEQGLQVAVLCEGDPFFYGSFMYLFARLYQKYQCQVIPGVSSLMAGAANIGAPLATRNDTLTVIPAPLDDDTIEQHLAITQAAVIIKLGRHMLRITELLTRLGLSDNAHYISHATLPQQIIMPLNQAIEQQTIAPYFSLIAWHKKGKAWIIPS